jgi:hypothetical protein
MILPATVHLISIKLLGIGSNINSETYKLDLVGAQGVRWDKGDIEQAGDYTRAFAIDCFVGVKLGLLSSGKNID